MVGEGVLHIALQSASVTSVLVIGRRSCEVKDPKLTEILHHDFFNYSGIDDRIAGFDACFFCLGVTSIGKDEKEYTRLTYELTMSAATILARLNPSMTFCYVSGTGTDSSERGRTMWGRVKGKTENDLQKLGFKAVYLFRPGFIKPIRGLHNAYGASKVLGLFYPLWKFALPNYVCTLEDIGVSMIRVAEEGFTTPILENRDIEALALRSTPSGTPSP